MSKATKKTPVRVKNVLKDDNVYPAVYMLGSIEQSAEKGIEVLRQSGKDWAYIIFNELPIMVTKVSTVRSLCDRYYELRKSHHYAGFCSNR